ncbi:transglutaminase domain-containing protein [Kordia sp.]|uniref:transglutaminase domain-containing protein n=1 Tax=Kordia sp. TaxID=1965332 RepID=UPI0025BAC005|nr:transglutaminase domain-containing protein [Kordia sp.]MCH2195103.1 transglutaminase domain-containing protein [Kordia sp.]
MKKNIVILLGVCTIFACDTDKKEAEKKPPVIKANSIETVYKVDTDWYRGRWGIAPHVEHDTLKITCYTPKTAFLFKTDIDSIEFEIAPDISKDFYVQLNDSLMAHTIITGVPFKTMLVDYNKAEDSDIEIKYQDGESKYLESLKKAYPVEMSDAMSDKEKVLHVLNWTNSRWKHNGNNSPRKNDAISILQEAEEGGQFPCFAYAIVLRDQLNALGFKARTVYLKTADAKTRKSSPGHVATEVFLNDLQKWVFIDGQFNVMPSLNGVPLNAIEFQKAIGANFDTFKLESLASEEAKVSKTSYVNFVYDYLYYIETTLDNRYEREERFMIDGKASLMLVPSGAANLDHIDFWDMDVHYCKYTTSSEIFYAKPS